jgi:biotin carboxyl carrier protein
VTTVKQVVAEDALSDLPDRFVVSPDHGRLSFCAPRSYTTEGEVVRAGDVLAVLHSGSAHIEVRAPCDAWVIALLVRDGERVDPGAPIAHLRVV